MFLMDTPNVLYCGTYGFVGAGHGLMSGIEFLLYINSMFPVPYHAFITPNNNSPKHKNNHTAQELLRIWPRASISLYLPRYIKAEAFISPKHSQAAMNSSSPMSSPGRAGPERINSRRPPQRPYSKPMTSKPMTSMKEDLCLAKAPCAAPNSTLDFSWGSRSPSLKPTSKGPGGITMDLSLDAPDVSGGLHDTKLWFCCACISNDNDYAGPYFADVYNCCIHCDHKICSKCPRVLTES